MVLILLLSIGLADVRMIYPKHMSFTEDYINYGESTRYMGGANLGDIAPGQTLRIIIERTSASAKALPGEEFLWNFLEISAPEPGWTKQDSSLGPSMLAVSLTVPKEATGTKSFFITAVNTEGARGLRTPEKVPLQMNIEADIFEYLVSEGGTYYAYAGRLNDVKFKVRSKSIASDDILLEDMRQPSSWSRPKYVTVEPLADNEVSLFFEPDKEGLYDLDVKATRASNTEISDHFSAKLRVYPTLESKFNACANGFSLTTIILQPIYSLMGLIALV